MFSNKKEVDKILGALGEWLDDLKKGPIDLLVCGGAALQALGYVLRTTQDVDILAIVYNRSTLENKKTLPSHLLEAASKVAKDFNLPYNWINLDVAKRI